MNKSERGNPKDASETRLTFNYHFPSIFGFLHPPFGRPIFICTIRGKKLCVTRRRIRIAFVWLVRLAHSHGVILCLNQKAAGHYFAKTRRRRSFFLPSGWLKILLALRSPTNPLWTPVGRRGGENSRARDEEQKGDRLSFSLSLSSAAVSGGPPFLVHAAARLVGGLVMEAAAP